MLFRRSGLLRHRPLYCAEELNTILTGVLLFSGPEQLHGALYNIQDPGSPLVLCPLTFVRNQALSSVSFALDMLLHGLDSPSIAFQLLLAFSQLSLGCQGGYGDQLSMDMQSPIAFQSAYILVRLTSILLARSCSTLAFHSLVD